MRDALRAAMISYTPDELIMIANREFGIQLLPVAVTSPRNLCRNVSIRPSV